MNKFNIHEDVDTHVRERYNKLKQLSNNFQNSQSSIIDYFKEHGFKQGDVIEIRINSIDTKKIIIFNDNATYLKYGKLSKNHISDYNVIIRGDTKIELLKVLVRYVGYCNLFDFKN